MPDFLKNPAPFIDHTLLKPQTTAAQIRNLCEEAVEWGFASVCIPPVFVPLAADLLYGSEVALGTVVGFPLGYLPSDLKAIEAAQAVARGAREVDMVIHVGAALEGRIKDVEEDIRNVVRASEGGAVKVILECCYLEDSAKRELTEAVVRAGAAYVKTSTGFGSGGATAADVLLLSRVAAGRIGVKAAGGIRTWGFCRELLEAGATRIGTSAGLSLLREWSAAKG